MVVIGIRVVQVIYSLLSTLGRYLGIKYVYRWYKLSLREVKVGKSDLLRHLILYIYIYIYNYHLGVASYFINLDNNFPIAQGGEGK